MIKNITVSSKISSGEKSYKYFIGNLHDGFKVKPLHMLPKPSACVKRYHDKLNRLFSVWRCDLLQKYNTIWDKVRADVKKELDSGHFYNRKCLKTKVKSYGDEVTDFYDK